MHSVDKWSACVTLARRFCAWLKCVHSNTSQCSDATFIDNLINTHTHTPFNGPSSGTTRVSWYQKKNSPAHTKEEKEEFSQTTRSALSQRGLLDPIKPAYNRSRPNGQLKLTASAFNWLWISMPAVLATVPTVMQNSLYPLSTSSIIARHLNFMSFHRQPDKRW